MKYPVVTVQLYTDAEAERVVIERGLAGLMDEVKQGSKNTAPGGKCQTTSIIPTPLTKEGDCLVIIHVWLQHEPFSVRGQEWLVYHITGGACNATRGLVLVTRDGLAKYHHGLTVTPGCVDTALDVALPESPMPRGGGQPLS